MGGSMFNKGKWAGARAKGLKVKGAIKNNVVFYRAESQAISLTNMIPNGSFETNTTGWAGSGTLSRIAVPAPVHGEFGSWCGQNAHKVNGAHYIQLSSALSGIVSGRKYYIRSRVRFAINGYGNVIQFYNAANALANGVTAYTMPAVNTWYVYDALWTAPNANNVQLRFNFSNGSGNNDRTGQIDNIMMLDLTTAFGAGNEPDAATMKTLIENEGYWDGTKVIQW